MTNDILVIYDATDLLDAIEALDTAIRRLGDALRLSQGLWFVSSDLSAEDVADRLRRASGPRGRLFVVDASNADLAWFGLPEPLSSELAEGWRAGRP